MSLKKTMLNSAISKVDDESCWSVIDLYFKTFKSTHFQISEFNDFMNKKIKDVFTKKSIPKFIPKQLEEILDKRVQKINSSYLVKPEDRNKYIDKKDAFVTEEDFITLCNKNTMFKECDVDIILTKNILKQIRDYPDFESIIITENFQLNINERLADIVKQISWEVFIIDVFIESPCIKETDDRTRLLFPTECIQRGITYGADIYLDLQIYSPVDNKIKIKREHIGQIPIMVGCCYCNVFKHCHTDEDYVKYKQDLYDEGGYFITKSEDSIEGSKKILTLQELEPQNVLNIPTVSKDFKNAKKNYVSLKSVNLAVNEQQVNKNIALNIFDDKKSNTFRLNATDFDEKLSEGGIPIKILFMGLGVMDTISMLKYIYQNSNIESFAQDSEFMKIILPPLEANTFNTFRIESREDALYYIGSRLKIQTVYYNKLSTPYTKNKPIVKDERPESLTRDEVIQKGMSYLYKCFLPGISVNIGQEFLTKKAIYFGYLLKKLIESNLKDSDGKPRLEPDDKDSFANKRVKTVNILFTTKLQEVFKDFLLGPTIKETIAEMDKKRFTFTFENKKTEFSNNVKKCLTKNTWTVWDKGAKDISKVFTPTNRAMYLIDARKVSQFFGPQANVIPPRELSNSQWGIFSPHDTPDGDKIGFNKGLALMAHISEYSDPKTVYVFVEALKEVNIFPNISIDESYIFINGALVGTTKTVDTVIKKLRAKRRSGAIKFDISISLKKNINNPNSKEEIHILTDEGRVMRPLLVVENNKPTLTKKDITDIKANKKTWNDLIINGKIEYLDKIEEEGIDILETFYVSDLENISSDKKISHSEIHPSLILGVADSIIPHVNRVNTCRNNYQSHMVKQGAAIPTFNFWDTIKGHINILIYPQRPLCSTRYSSLLKIDKNPTGQNITTAILCFRGGNQEDSMVVNAMSSALGMLSILHYHYYSIEVHRDSGDIITIPTEDNCPMKTDFSYAYKNNVRNLDENGIVKIGSKISKGDILVGKLVKVRDIYAKYTYRCDNLVYDLILDGIVEKIDRGYTGDGVEFIKIVISQYRPLGVGQGFKSGGDKVASRFAQKGTVGEILEPWQMPYTESGVVIDGIMNPNAYPSRMSIGQLIESLTGNLLLSSSKLQNVYFGEKGLVEITRDSLNKSYFSDETTVDATLGVSFSVDEVIKELKSYGVNEFGSEVLYNPMTGEKMDALVTVGPVFYQRLKHMVIDKANSRGKGKTTSLTQQPVGGGAGNRNPGLRLSWQEVISLGSNGLAGILYDRLYEHSDKFTLWVCSICGLPSYQNSTKNGAHCSICNTNDCKLVKIPFATRGLYQYLAGANIVTRMIPNDEPDD